MPKLTLTSYPHDEQRSKYSAPMKSLLFLVSEKPTEKAHAITTLYELLSCYSFYHISWNKITPDFISVLYNVSPVIVTFYAHTRSHPAAVWPSFSVFLRPKIKMTARCGGFSLLLQYRYLVS